MSQVVSLKIGATSLEGNSAKGSSMDFALSQKEPFLLSMCWLSWMLEPRYQVRALC